MAYPGAVVTTGEYPNPVDSTNFLGKIDHQVNGRDQLGVRYSLYKVDSINSRGIGGTTTPGTPSAIGRTRQHRSVDSGQQHHDALGADGQRDAGAVYRTAT